MQTSDSDFQLVMSNPATIDHQAVHINLTKHGTDSVTTQPESVDGAPTVQYDAPTAMAIFTKGPTPVVAQKPDPKLKPKDFVMTSCFVIFACNFIFGLLGYHFGAKSNHAWQLGDIAQAKHHAKKALIFVIIGVLVGIITYVMAFVLYFVILDTPDHDVESRST
ncbi:transmembrane protein 91 [Plakobranchus ocellatus]|uniref:Transmembrane protein 91 n=1 Tax=Plakobranchus ocellatus TaxID=259542 RepID=A0AAV3Z0V4_9GAST|nr:transmembrane protein 91 [Plakobranchus ocellatus]